MLKKSLNKNSYSENINTSKENIICKDGFCSLPNQGEVSKQHKNDTNVFDPVQKLKKLFLVKDKIDRFQFNFLNFD